ncbi:MAG: efflux transporter periplasmic adaptor subunit [Hyphomicrobiales bacterium]|nr:MAG: efflux transporter periplasmic adaptor subunit [Hyphomicrobiales bacterium]
MAGGAYYYLEYWGGGMQAAAPSKPRVQSVQLAKAEPGTIRVEVEAVGTAQARQAVDLVALVSGRIIEIRFKPGQQVRKGEVLVRLDDAAERAALDEAAAALKEAEFAYNRARKLKKNNTISQATVEKQEAAVNSGKARLDLMEKRLADRTIRAPFDGVTGLQRVDVGARIDSETVITTLDDLSQIEINFSIPEIHFSKIRIGKPVEVRTAVFKNRVFKGKVTDIDTRIQEASRAFKVRAVLPNPDGLIPSGMFMHVSVLIAEQRAILIPEEAVIAEGGSQYVFTVAEGKAHRRGVKLGQRGKGKVAVLNGLKAGEEVVRLGHHRLRDGTLVKTGEAGAQKSGAGAV